jgi:hypothetical protein
MEPPSRQPEFHDLGFAGRPIRVGGTISANEALQREAIERTRGAEAIAEIRNATVHGAEALGG